MLSRRAFLGTTAVLAIVPALPTISSVAPAAAAVKPATTIWVGGHNGEYDWQAFNAVDEEDAIRQLFDWHGRDVSVDGKPYTLKEADMAMQRVARMDGLQVDEIKGHHWIRAGLGHSCDRCDNECSGSDGARAMGTEVVCEDCLTFRDKVALGGYDDELEDELTEIMVDNDLNEGEVLEILSMRGDADVVTPALWVKCLGYARAEL